MALTTTIRVWTATMITIPVSLVLLVMAIISTGSGHGTGMLLNLFYAPLFLLFSNSLLGNPLWGPLLHLAYAICVDRIRANALSAHWFWAAIAFHYLSFFFLIATKENGTSGNAWLIMSQQDRLLLLLFLLAYLAWQLSLTRLLKRPPQ